MKRHSIAKFGRRKLRGISGTRSTTVCHSFAGAIAPLNRHSDLDLISALEGLGQNPYGDLDCVYCEVCATGWDHLVGLVKDGELRGFGHQLGNLVPCCHSCNSSKGGKDWEKYLRSVVPDDVAYETKRCMLAAHLERYATPIDLERLAILMPELWARYCELKRLLFTSMAEADEIAAELCREVASKTGASLEQKVA
jgi:hypothetical protein